MVRNHDAHLHVYWYVVLSLVSIMISSNFYNLIIILLVSLVTVVIPSCVIVGTKYFVNISRYNPYNS
jgi:hypothetical protein